MKKCLSAFKLILKGQKMQQDALEGLEIWVFKAKEEKKRKKEILLIWKLDLEGYRICVKRLFFNTLLHIKTADTLK